MSQRTVERVIGRLVTDEELRLDFTRAPKETLAASDAAARMDPRLQRSEAHLDQQVLDSLLGKERSQYRAQRDALVAQGCPIASEFSVPWGAQICYIDARHIVGHMIELYPPDDILRDLYRQTREAALNWDGKQLIVPWLT